MLLKDLVKIKGGKRLPNGVFLTTTRNEHPYIRVKDLNNTKLSITNDIEYVPEGVFPLIRNYTVNTGDIILSIVGTIGLVAYVDESLDNANLTENCVKFVDFSKICNKKYLFFYLLSDKGRQQISSSIVGSTQPKLPIYNIEKFDIPLVPLVEQQHIVDTI